MQDPGEPGIPGVRVIGATLTSSVNSTLAHGSPAVEAKRQKVNAFLRSTDIFDGIADFDAAIKLNPNDAIAWHSRGLAYRDIRDYERAIQDFDAAIKINPEFILALNDRGMLLQTIAKVVLAIYMYTRLPGTLLKAFLMTLVSGTMMAASLVVLVPHGFASALGPLDYTIALGAGMIGNILPLTPGGIGIGEGTFAFICRILENHATTAAFGTIFLSFRLAGIISLLLFLPAFPFKRQLFHEMPPASDDRR